MKKRKIAIAFLLFFSLVLAGCTEGIVPETASVIAETPIISLMDEFPRAKVETRFNKKNVDQRDISIKGERRPVLLMAPPSKVTFPPITIPHACNLGFGVGVTEDAWLREGDGMNFSVSVKTPDLSEPVQIYSRYVDPKNILGDQRWFDERVSLSEYAGREVEFILTTSAGEAGDRRADWGGWSQLEIFVTDDPPSQPIMALTLALIGVLAGACLGLAIAVRKLATCARQARAYRMAFSLSVISIPVAYGCYPYLAANLPTLTTFVLGVVSLSVASLMCAAIMILWMCGTRKGTLARMGSALDIALFNIALIALLAEAGIRVLGLFTDNPLVASDPKSGISTVQVVNAHLESRKGMRYEHGFFFNSMGFPDREFEIPKPSDTFRILALADSFGVVPTMPYEYNHVTLLEDKLQGFAGSSAIDICNLGMTAKGPAHYLAILEELGTRLNPDLVLMYFFLGNDFVPYGAEQIFVSRWDRFEIYRVLSRLRRTSRIDLEGKGLSAEEEVQVSIPDYVRDWRLEEPFMPRDQFLRLEQGRARFFDPDLSEVHYAGAIRYIESIAALARELTGNPLVMIVIPDELQVNVELRNEVEQLLRKELDIDKPLRYLRNNLEYLGDDRIVIIDLLPRFQAAQTELERVYFLQETHWNVNGNRVGAEETARQLWNLRDKILKD